MHGPQLAADSLANEHLVGRGQQVIVEPDEIERCADPGNARDEVYPTAEQAQEFEHEGAHEVIGRRWDRSRNRRYSPGSRSRYGERCSRQARRLPAAAAAELRWR